MHRQPCKLLADTLEDGMFLPLLCAAGTPCTRSASTGCQRNSGVANWLHQSHHGQKKIWDDSMDIRKQDFKICHTSRQFSDTGIELLHTYKITHVPHRKTMHIKDLREDLRTCTDVLGYIMWCRSVDADFARTVVKDFQHITQ